MAAAKCILSMRRWAYMALGDESLLRFVAMATPEDLNANAEFIRQVRELSVGSWISFGVGVTAQHTRLLGHLKSVD